MDYEAIFSLNSTAAMVGWAVLILAPRRWPLLNMIPAWIIPLGISAVYAALVMVHFGPAEGGFGSLADVRLLLSGDAMLLAGWVHYLAFDLFIGAVMAVQMDKVALHRVIQAPLLVLIFMFGPLGLLITLLTIFGQRVLLKQDVWGRAA